MALVQIMHLPLHKGQKCHPYPKREVQSIERLLHSKFDCWNRIQAEKVNVDEFSEAPFTWKLLKIGSFSVRDIIKNVPNLQLG